MRAFDISAADSLLSRVGGTNPELQLNTISLPENVVSGSVLFFRNEKFFKNFAETSEKVFSKISPSEICFILDSKLQSELEKKNDALYSNLKEKCGALYSSTHVDVSVAKLSEHFYQEKHKNLNNFVDGRQMGTAQVHPTAMIAQNVFLGENVVIGPNVILHSGVVILSHSTVDEETEIYPHVTIYPFVKIGKKCRIHANVTVGADGFGYHFFQGKHTKVWHLGGVVIGDDVEIGANSCIDQGAFRPTIIGSGSKIDNQVQVGHNVKLGPGVVLCGQVGVAGSTSIGAFTVVGGGAGIGPDLEIGQACQIAGMAGLNCDLEANSKVAGHPARPVSEWLRGVATLRKISLNPEKK